LLSHPRQQKSSNGRGPPPLPFSGYIPGIENALGRVSLTQQTHRRITFALPPRTARAVPFVAGWLVGAISVKSQLVSGVIEGSNVS
jgi:hypothetical protein